MQRLFATLRRGGGGGGSSSKDKNVGADSKTSTSSLSPRAEPESPVVLQSVEVQREAREKLFAPHPASSADFATLRMEEADIARLFSEILPAKMWAAMGDAVSGAGLDDKKYWRPPLPVKDALLDGVAGTRIEPEMDGPPRTPASELCFGSLLATDAQVLRSLWKRLAGRHASCAPPHPFFTDVAGALSERLDEVFDQYNGIKQVGDLRSLGPDLHQAGLQYSNTVWSSTLALLVWTLGQAHEQLIQTADGGPARALVRALETRLRALLDGLLADFKGAMSVLVRSMPIDSSKSLTVRPGVTYNEHFKEQLVAAVIAATADHERALRAQYTQLVSHLDTSTNAQTRQRVWSRVGGRERAAQLVDDACSGLRPWAVDWLAVQQQAFTIREVFGDERSIAEALQQSVDTMVMAFKDILQSFVADPLIELPDLFESLDPKL